ncbi:hypothetical protein CCP2SC5_1410008 [Azospirillaceae bacterium]
MIMSGVARERSDDRVLLRVLACLPEGVGELYCHPATHTCETLARTMEEYDHAGELAALTSGGVRALLDSQNVRRLSFLDLLSSES